MAAQQNISPLTHKPNVAPGVISSVVNNANEKTKVEILEMVGSIKGDLIGAVKEVVAEEGEKSLDRMATMHAETQAFIRNPRAMREQLVSDKSLLGRKNQQYFNEGAYSTVTDARNFVRNSPVGAVLETTNWVTSALLLTGLVTGYLFGGDPVEDALK